MFRHLLDAHLLSSNCNVSSAGCSSRRGAVQHASRVQHLPSGPMQRRRGQHARLVTVEEHQAEEAGLHHLTDVGRGCAGRGWHQHGASRCRAGHQRRPPLQVCFFLRWQPQTQPQARGPFRCVASHSLLSPLPACLCDTACPICSASLGVLPLLWCATCCVSAVQGTLKAAQHVRMCPGME